MINNRVACGCGILQKHCRRATSLDYSQLMYSILQRKMFGLKKKSL